MYLSTPKKTKITEWNKPSKKYNRMNKKQGKNRKDMKLIFQFSDSSNQESCYMKGEVKQILTDVLKEKIKKEISHDGNQPKSHIR